MAHSLPPTGISDCTTDATPIAIHGATLAGSGGCRRRPTHAPIAHDAHRPSAELDATEGNEVWTALARMLRARDDARRLHPSYSVRWG